MSREESIKNFNDVVSMGYEYEEIKEDGYEERTLKLSDNLCLCLFDSENYTSPEISMVKSLPEGTDVHYHDNETWLHAGRFQGRNVSLKEDKIFVNLTPYKYSYLLPVQLYFQWIYFKLLFRKCFGGHIW